MTIKRTTTYSFTRPADTTAYASGDLVANSTTAGSVVPLSWNTGKGGIKIVGIRLFKSTTTAANATFTLNLFGTSPTVANGDNGALSTSGSDRFAVNAMPIMIAGTDVATTFLNGGETGLLDGDYHYTSTGLIYGLLSAAAAYTPASAEVFSCSLIYDLVK